MEDFSFFDSSSSFRFLLIEFHCTFPFLLKYYLIMFIIIIVSDRVMIGRRDFFFSCLLFTYEQM